MQIELFPEYVNRCILILVENCVFYQMSVIVISSLVSQLSVSHRGVFNVKQLMESI